MIKRKKAIKEEHSFLTIEVSGYKARVDASINYEVRDKRHYYEDAKVYKFGSYLEIEGTCTYPEERAEAAYRFIIYGNEARDDDFESKLIDYHVKDDKGMPQFPQGTRSRHSYI